MIAYLWNTERRNRLLNSRIQKPSSSTHFLVRELRQTGMSFDSTKTNCSKHFPAISGRGERKKTRQRERCIWRRWREMPFDFVKDECIIGSGSRLPPVASTDSDKDRIGVYRSVSLWIEEKRERRACYPIDKTRNVLRTFVTTCATTMYSDLRIAVITSCHSCCRTTDHRELESVAFFYPLASFTIDEGKK